MTDLALLAVFGDPFGLDPAGAAGKEALTTDNVASDSQFLDRVSLPRRTELSRIAAGATRSQRAGARRMVRRAPRDRAGTHRGRRRVDARRPEVRDADIAFFTARAARDPYGAGDRARLASLLLARARATGRYEDLVSAEESARASLDLQARPEPRRRAGADQRTHGTASVP